MKLADELKLMQKAWKKSKARNIQKPLPDGPYVVRIIDVRLDRSKTSDRLQVVWVMQVKGGKYKGRVLTRYSGLESESNISFLKTDFKALDVKAPKNIINITKTLEKCIDLKVDISLKTSGQYTNIYFNGIHGADNDNEVESEE